MRVWPLLCGDAVGRRGVTALQVRWGWSLAVVLLMALAACRTALEVQRPSSHQEILRALARHGEAAVLVALVEPPASADPRQPAQATAAIARMQDEVEAALDSADFVITKRFNAVPALAGILKTERGLRLLTALPQVRAVSLDTGGGGST